MELRSIDPALVCQAFFIGGAIAALAGCAVPSLRNTLFSYGLRTLAPISQASKAASQPSSRLDSLIKFAAQLQVPHTWFTHYYAASVAFSVFWAHQLLIEGSAFQALRSLSSNDHKPSMSVHQVYVSWALMAFQGCRRLYESIEYLKPSEARMPFAIYAGGMLIYFFMGISVWIEGMPALSTRHLASDEVSASDIPMRTIAGMSLFFIASYAQHICHRHLAGLRKYTLPQHPLFTKVLCPHYTSECFIYLGLAAVAAPEGQLLNRTIATFLLLSATDLAITAESTRKWYSQKFGADKISSRWRMVPYIY